MFLSLSYCHVSPAPARWQYFGLWVSGVPPGVSWLSKYWSFSLLSLPLNPQLKAIVFRWISYDTLLLYLAWYFLSVQCKFDIFWWNVHMYITIAATEMQSIFIPKSLTVSYSPTPRSCPWQSVCHVWSFPSSCSLVKGTMQFAVFPIYHLFLNIRLWKTRPCQGRGL